MTQQDSRMRQQMEIACYGIIYCRILSFSTFGCDCLPSIYYCTLHFPIEGSSRGRLVLLAGEKQIQSEKMPREEKDEEESLPSDTKRQQVSSGSTTTTSALDSATSFFSSVLLFGGQNHNSKNSSGRDLRNEIHTQLNVHEELQTMRSHRRKILEPEPQQHQQQHTSQSQQQSSPLPTQQQQQLWTESDDENDHPTRPTQIQNLAGVTDRLKGWWFYSDSNSTSQQQQEQQQSRISYRAADGAYYVVSQNPRDGARIDVQPPFMMPKGKENGGISVELVRENGPCQIRWRRDNHSERVVAGTSSSANNSNNKNNTNNENIADQGLRQHMAIVLGQEHASRNNNHRPKNSEPKPPKKKKKNNNHPLIELDDYVDCARLSAEIYRTRNHLTLTAPVKQSPGTGKPAQEQQQHQHQQPPPRFVPVVKRS